jgi:pyruvate dehydrogenase E1 component alpha subunit
MDPPPRTMEPDAVPDDADGAPARYTDADLESLLTIRCFEEKVLDLFTRGAIAGTTHTCLGQEHIPVALMPLLRDDFVLSNHRGHGHYLARFGDPSGLLAELMGRAGAVCRGVGGSQHIHREGYLSTGVQGESLPVAVGVALHLRHGGAKRIAAVFVGDGTWGEGAVYEALNMAQLWRAPVLVVVENNGIAQSTPTERHMAGTIAGRAAAFGIPHHRLTTLDIGAIRALVAPWIAAVRHTGGPLVLEFDTVRLGPHSKGDDTRDVGELRRLRERDWYHWYARWHPEHLAAIEPAVRARIDRLAAEVADRPPSTWSPR